METIILICSTVSLIILVAIFIELHLRRKADLLSIERILVAQVQQLGELLREEIARQREEIQRTFKDQRQELNASETQTRSELRQGFADFQVGVRTSLHDAAQVQKEQLMVFSQRLDRLQDLVGQALEKISQSIETRLKELQTSNESKLEQMRLTVDEKLQETLTKRLGDSFRIVSERLEQVHKGLGEMQGIAASVDDLKRVFSNVKTLGTWGEIRLESLLKQILAPDQYATNVQVKPDSPNRVEFAIKLPGQDYENRPVWLPLDSKFPAEDYLQLLDVVEKGDSDTIEKMRKSLETRLRTAAKEIKDKYIHPPYTSDFGIMFLPVEGLYAEALRIPKLSEDLQRLYRVMIAGPTTLAALLTSLQMGFRSVAIHKRSAEVLKLMVLVKNEFEKFGQSLSRVKQKLNEASREIDKTEKTTIKISQQLNDVQSIPSESIKPELLDVHNVSEADDVQESNS